jgi:hypothetical protein
MSNDQEITMLIATLIGAFLLLPATVLFSVVAVFESDFKSNVLPPFFSLFSLANSPLIGFAIIGHFLAGERMPNYEWLTMVMVGLSLFGFSQLDASESTK